MVAFDTVTDVLQLIRSPCPRSPNVDGPSNSVLRRVRINPGFSYRIFVFQVWQLVPSPHTALGDDTEDASVTSGVV